MSLALRAYGPADVALLARVDSEFEDFGIRSPHRAVPGNLWEEPGGLVVTDTGADDERVLGSVSWYRPSHGPGEGSRCHAIGIGLLPEARGRGAGTWAQAELARLIFDHTPSNRIEASTDVTNLAEQKALARAGFTREGVLRGAQWRLGAWHDMVSYARLRADAGPGTLTQ